jgi:dTDP-3-amino-3,4,6-trideoxy-alpha-D-glucose transaminase
MDELQAAVLRAKLPLLEPGNARRRQIAESYTEALKGTSIAPMAALEGRTHAHHLYVVRTPRRDAFRAELARAGVGTLVHYPHPIHRHAPYREAARPGVPLDVSESLAQQIVSLPLHPALGDDEVQIVIEVAVAASLTNSVRRGR